VPSLINARSPKPITDAIIPTIRLAIERPIAELCGDVDWDPSECVGARGVELFSMSRPQCLQAIASAFISSAQKGHFFVSDWLSNSLLPCLSVNSDCHPVPASNFLTAKDFCQWWHVQLVGVFLTSPHFSILFIETSVENRAEWSD